MFLINKWELVNFKKNRKDGIRLSDEPLRKFDSNLDNLQTLVIMIFVNVNIKYIKEFLQVIIKLL